MFDTMVWTKIIGAFCGALLIFLVGKWVADELYVAGSRDLEPAFSIALADDDADVGDVVELTFDQAMAVAEASAGQGLYAQCRACHSLDEGRNGVGPYLHNVMGRDIASVDAFNYSGALPEDEVWQPANLNAFLENPRGWAPGTSMAYAGMRNKQDRANLIAYLIDQSPDFDYTPPEVEEAPAEEAPAEEAPVDEVPVDEAPVDDAATTEEVPTEDEAAADSPIAQAYAQADASAGQALWRNCQACHVADQETNRVGPHLVGMLGREVGALEGFRYSGNLPEGVWSLENLDAFLENPRGFAPGTTMVYPGMRDLQDRANLIAYIDSLAD